MKLALGLVVSLVSLGAAPKAAEPLGETIVLTVGEQRVMTPKCNLSRIAVDASPPVLQRIAVGDASIADVKTIGNNQVLLIGAAIGKTTLLLWCSNGQRISWLVDVRPGRPPEHSVPVKVEQKRVDATAIDDEGAHPVRVTMVELPGDLRDVEEVVSADGGVTYVGRDSVGSRVTITAVPYLPRPRARPDAGVAGRDAGRGDGGTSAR